MEYKIIEEHADPHQSVILKTGTEEVKAEFTVSQVSAEIDSFRKTLKEKESELGIQKATMENLTSFHPEILTTEEKVRQAIYLYVEAQIRKEVLENSIKIYTETIEKQTEELKTIMADLSIPNIVNLKDLE